MKTFFISEDGQGMVEYVLVTALIALAAITGYKILGGSINESIHSDIAKVQAAEAGTSN